MKTRIVAHGQQVVRADREDAADVPARAETALVESVRRELPSCGALVISDYQKGVVTASLLKRVLPLAKRRGVPVLVDPKVRHFRLYRGASVVTPNQLEAEQATGLRLRSPAEVVAAGRRILSLLGCRAVLVTRGEHGMSLFERGRPPLHVPTAAREVFDVTGAGDSVIATMALALAAGATLPEAAVLANCAAGVVVGKVGTAQASPAEVLAAARVAARAARGPGGAERRGEQGEERNHRPSSAGPTAAQVDPRFARVVRQCRKCRTPLKTMARPCSSAAAIVSSSRTEPAGWMIAVEPSSDRVVPRGRRRRGSATFPRERQHRLRAASGGVHAARRPASSPRPPRTT